MVRLVIKPRVQKDKWSLYWKTSMMTKTEMLDDIVLDVADPSAMTGAQLKAAVRAPSSHCYRLHGVRHAASTLRSSRGGLLRRCPNGACDNVDSAAYKMDIGLW
jgi:hypothetical protein